MLKTLLCTLLLFLVACHDSGSSVSIRDSEIVRNLDSFVLFKSSGDTVFLGTEKPEARVFERPRMGVILDYDFYLSKTEVSCEEYRSLMKDGAAKICQDGYPVSSITFFDAVLYANELSKKYNLDTAYSYSEKIFDLDGRCSNLVGFRFNPEAESFRLPTEAEWIKAASVSFNPENSWNLNNSDISVHPSCMADIDKHGVCDMAGNLKEWVNDWYGHFKDTTLVNYLGAPDGGVLTEHVIKGGAFNMAPENIHLYSRGDTYTVSASTYAYYVGFRLAYGKIPNGIWTDENGNAVTENYSLLVRSGEVFRMLKTANSKLAFRDEVSGNLALVDFYDANARIVVYPDTIQVYHPEFSPDGNWIAFCTSPEGIYENSKVYVRKENALIPLKVEHASIPRFRMTEQGDTVLVYVTSAQNNTDEGSFMEQSTWQVSFKNGIFGTPVKLFDGAYHGGVSVDNHLAVTGARKLRARIAQKNETILEQTAKDTLWYNEEQACNVSLSRDDSKRTLFLDFGGQTGRKFVGEKYSVHEQILVMDSTGKLIHHVAAPKNYSFDHTEWINENFDAEGDIQKFAIATLTNQDGAHRIITLVNMEDGSRIDLVEGEELFYPSFWMNSIKNVKMNKTLDIDSAGLYYSDRFLLSDALWRYKMELFWQYRDSVQVLVVGSSRSLNGFRSKLLDSTHFSINVSQTPNSIFTSRDLLRNYAFNHLKTLKYVVLSLDLDFWWETDDESYNFFRNDYKSYPGFVYDKNHDYWKDGYPDGLYEMTRNALGIRMYDKEIYRKELGSQMGVCVMELDSVPPMDVDTSFVQEYDNALNSFSALEEILDAAPKNVTVIGVIFPQSSVYQKTGAFGRHGLRRSNAEKLIDLLKKMDASRGNFILMDENQMGNHDYEERLFGDSDHLCMTGASKLTRRVEAVIKAQEE